MQCGPRIAYNRRTNRFSVTRSPADWATKAILFRSSSDTLGPTTLSRLASVSKSVPEREAPSIPSAISASPGSGGHVHARRIDFGFGAQP